MKPVIARREATKQSRPACTAPGLLRRCVPRNDGLTRGHAASGGFASYELTQGVRELETLAFGGTRIEHGRRARPGTFHLGGVVRVKPGALIKGARVRIHVAAAALVDVEADHLPTDRAFRAQRMKPLAAEELDELDRPGECVPHRRFSSDPATLSTRLCPKSESQRGQAPGTLSRGVPTEPTAQCVGKPRPTGHRARIKSAWAGGRSRAQALRAAFP